MYVQINNEYVPVDIASDILGIDKDDLIDAGHTVADATQPSFINYQLESNVVVIYPAYTEVIEDLIWEQQYFDNTQSEY